jgi:hypothetical protein
VKPKKPEHRVAEFRQHPLEERQAVVRRQLGLIDEEAFKRILGGVRSERP